MAGCVGRGLEAEGSEVARLGDGVTDSGTEPEVFAAGGIVWRVVDGGVVEIAVVHRPGGYDDWTFPKGKRESQDDSDEACALREVEEETGYRCVLGRELPSVEYRDGKQRRKRVRYWEMTVSSGRFSPSAEIDDLSWLPVAVAARRLTYVRDRDVLASFAGFAGIDAASA